MYRGNDGRLYENVWTRDGWKRNEVGTEYPHNCVNCDAVVGTRNHSKHSINGVPQKCERCYRHSEIRKTTVRIRRRLDEWQATRDAGNRKVHRDIACRYIARYHGETYAIQTEIDDCKIFLKDAHGTTIAEVLSTDRFPKLPRTADFHEIPF